MYHYVYVLLSEKDSHFYIGYTSNLKRRLTEHNQGKNTSTRYRRPLKLLFFEGFLNKPIALKREKYFKTSSGKRSIRLILNRN